ncbi:GNAT family N-acetyltransferase [Lachnoclostridium phytofermentans]|nr:GNAT family N-acetyltransferase [Lachnoclostridium phytofermentans]
MIKVTSVSEEKIREIGEKIGQAFWAENCGVATLFSEKECISFFRIITQVCYRAGCLYTTSDNMEGFVVYYRKKEKPALRYQMQMLRLFLKEIPMSTWLHFLKNQRGWKGFEARCKKEPDYVCVFMLVVLKEFQGKGFMRQMLHDPFAVAKEKHIPCVLDTDTLLKTQKYQHCGMKIVVRNDIPIRLPCMRWNIGNTMIYKC